MITEQSYPHHDISLPVPRTANSPIEDRTTHTWQIANSWSLASYGLSLHQFCDHSHTFSSFFEFSLFSAPICPFQPSLCPAWQTASPTSVENLRTETIKIVFFTRTLPSSSFNGRCYSSSPKMIPCTCF